jgi:hypothetical protein
LQRGLHRYLVYVWQSVYTWFPTCLVKYRELNFLQSGFLAAFEVILLSGFLSDYIVRKNVSLNIARKIPAVEPALIFIACPGLMGALSYIFLLGKVERIEVKKLKKNHDDV